MVVGKVVVLLLIMWLFYSLFFQHFLIGGQVFLLKSFRLFRFFEHYIMISSSRHDSRRTITDICSWCRPFAHVAWGKQLLALATAVIIFVHSYACVWHYIGIVGCPSTFLGRERSGMNITWMSELEIRSVRKFFTLLLDNIYFFAMRKFLTLKFLFSLSLLLFSFYIFLE